MGGRSGRTTITSQPGGRRATCPTSAWARLAQFLDIDITDEQLAEAVRVTDFGYMREHALASEAKAGGPGDGFFAGGVGAFLYKGTNGRWRDVLTAAELDQYEAKMASLDPGLRAWLEGGRNLAT
jgi:aryl sulfotransferase